MTLFPPRVPTNLPTLFAAAAVLLLAAGIFNPRVLANRGMSITSSQNSYFLPTSMLCYGAAGCCCACACLYSLFMVPWSTRAATWHFALSLLLIALFFIGLTAPRDYADLSSRASVLTLVLSIFAPILFILLQAVFALDIVRRLWLLHLHR